MKPRLSRLITRTILNPKEKRGEAIAPYSDYDLAKGWYELKLIVKGLAMDVLMIIMGIVSAGFGLKGFLLINGFIDGGATGISLLVAELTGTSLSILLLLVNLPFMILGLKVIGRTFTIKAILAIIGLAIVVAVVPYPEITHDKLLIAVFGGFFLGTGIDELTATKTAAAILGQVTQQFVHRAVIGRIKDEPPFLARACQPGGDQFLEVKGQAPVRFDLQRFGNLADRQPGDPGTHQQAEDLQTGFMGQRTQRSHGRF